jgi:cation diffusion facilitator CzcD-associated flavoprotein CzcO
MPLPRRFTSAAAPGADEDAQHEVLPYDVCVVGAGPAGLAAAIRIRQARVNAAHAADARGTPAGNALTRRAAHHSCVRSATKTSASAC